MIVSKFRSGLCYPPDLIVWRPIVWNPLQLAKCHVEMTDRRSVIFVKPFSQEQKLQEPVISRSNKGMAVILSEAIETLPDDCIGVRIVQSFDRYAFGEVVRGPVSSYLIWRETGIGCPVDSKRVTIERHGDEHFKCICQ